MAGSIWERFGERVGYGLAVIILGPHAALERRARRAMRTALAAWCAELQPVKLAAPRGILRRSVTLPGAAGSRSAEIELDIDSRQARVVVGTERLPKYVEARIGKGAHSLYPGLKRRMGPPRASASGFRLDSQTLDLDVAKALVEAVAAGPLDRLSAVEVDLSAERIELLAVAPTASEEWAAIGDGVVALASWLTTRWGSSYRT